MNLTPGFRPIFGPLGPTAPVPCAYCLSLGWGGCFESLPLAVAACLFLCPSLYLLSVADLPLEPAASLLLCPSCLLCLLPLPLFPLLGPIWACGRLKQQRIITTSRCIYVCSRGQRPSTFPRYRCEIPRPSGPYPRPRALLARYTRKPAWQGSREYRGPGVPGPRVLRGPGHLGLWLLSIPATILKSYQNPSKTLLEPYRNPIKT